MNARIINVDFKDMKNGQYKIISFYAKKARGLMARWIIKERISTPISCRPSTTKATATARTTPLPITVFLRDASDQ